MPPDELEIQGRWDPTPLRAQWPSGLDNYFLATRLEVVPVEATGLGASGRVLEVAAAEAVHSCRLAQRGLQCFVVEPSPPMLAKARENSTGFGIQLNLIRGIAETLPFPDQTFDRVLCDSALDHLASPDAGIREMVRVLKPDGRLVVSFVNYGSLSVRVSRLYYRVERALNPAARREARFWDSPVPYEHTFEGTYHNIAALCGQYLELDRSVGVSMLWQTPGWAGLLRRMDPERAGGLLATIDRVARRVPQLADYVLMVWRPRQNGAAHGSFVGNGHARALPRIETMRVTPADPIYQRRVREDLEFERRWTSSPVIVQRAHGARRYTNELTTGDAKRSWLDDLMARGPFQTAAALGAGDEVASWIEAGASERLDVFDPSAAGLERTRGRLGANLRRVWLRQADWNFLRLDRSQYDVVWSASALSRVTNLEYLLDEVALALRAGGLFAFQAYVGERRQQYDPARLARINAVLGTVPERFRFGVDAIAATSLDTLSPFGAIRSDEIVALAKQRFDVVLEVQTGALFPLLMHLDLPGLAREAPDVLAAVLAAEREAQQDSTFRRCSAYVVLRRRG